MSASLEQQSNEELRASFRQHTMRGLVISVSLLVVFCIFYFVPMDMQPEAFNFVIIAIAVVSVSLAIWYHLGRRKYYKEFKRRDMRIRG